MTINRRLLSSLCALAVATLFLADAQAAAPDGGGLWQPVRATSIAATAAPERVLLAPAPTLRLDENAFRALLDQTPMEGTQGAAAGPTVLTLPLPDGTFGRFRIEESPVMEPELAARFPEIHTYRGQGIDDPTATVRFDWTPAGLHAMILSAGGTVFIDPFGKGDTSHYVSYYKKDYRRRDGTPFRCLVTGQAIDETAVREELAQAFGPAPMASFGGMLHTYKLALAADGDYSIAVCGANPTVPCVMSAMATTMTRVNGIYEREVAVHLSLIANDDQLIYTDPLTDPYSNDVDPAPMLCENQCNLDGSSFPGSANYDIGHVFATSGGGKAEVGVVCKSSGGPTCSCSGGGTVDGLKARGVTGSSNPLGDAFDVDLVAHEMGHQLGANHTFNGTAPFSSTKNFCLGARHAATAYEPGSGSTIMSYSGLCGVQNVQDHSDDYFHAGSLAEINALVNAGFQGAACGSTGGPGNTPPSITVPSGPFTIPKHTPFTLTATLVNGNDGGESLTVDWEEFDPNGAPSPPDDDKNAIRPILRSLPPTTSLSRTFPSLQYVLNGSDGPFEFLPSRARTMIFRATVRDNHAGQGGTAFADTKVVVTSSGPFKVAAPTATTTGWGVGARPTVTWDVANTKAAPVGCANVKISLSTDGGQTFPTVLVPSTPNNGSAIVTVPNAMTTQARVKIEAIGNIFFAISEPFTIGPGVTVSDATPVTEGSGSPTAATFTVSIPQAGTQTATVHYATSDGTATAASGDYVAQVGALTFLPGDPPKTVTVNINDDALFEVDETFFLNLTSCVNCGIVDGHGTGTATIQNDDPPPSVSINDVSVTEGNSGTRNAVFTVTLSTVSGAATVVPYFTADGTATAPSDYVAIPPATKALTVPAGATSGTLSVVIKGDAVIEPDETFLVNLSSSSTETVARTPGTGTILNDDAPGIFSFALANYAVSEAASLATIKVTRVNGNAAGATVDYAVTDGTANVGSDYNLPSASTLTFGANQLSATFTVPIAKDTIDEPNETVLLRVSNPQPFAAGARLGAQRTAVLTITDNDTPGKVQFSAATYKATEGEPAATITVKRLGGLASGVMVNYAATPGTASSPGDFTAIPSGTLSFGTSGIGATTQTFTVTIGADDGLPEGAKTVLLTLSSPTGGAVLGTPSSAVLTIGDAESTVEFSSTAYTVKESAASALVTVKRWGPLTGTATVGYATGDAGATAGSDYKAVSGTLTLGPNVSTKTFMVPILKDTLVEGPEGVNLTLSNPVGTALGAANPAVLTITDDDVLPKLQFSAPLYTVSEASPKAVITVKRSGNMAGTVVVDYAATGGTATNVPGSNPDYDLPSGTLTFTPGKSILTFPVTIIPDTIDEGTETALLTLGGVTLTWTNPGTPTIVGTNPATLRITDNEPTVQFTSAKFTASELSLKTNLMLRRTGIVTAPASVNYAITGGTATNSPAPGADYTLASSGTVPFPAGAATAALPVTLVPDKIDEPNETVIVTLSNPTGVGLGTPEVTTLTITDNDAAGKVQFGAANYSVDEGGISVNLTVTRTLATSELATVDYQVTGGSATNGGTDYTLAPGTLTFNPGEKAKTINVPIVEDALVEGNESVVVTLSNPGGGLALGTLSQTTLWIVDND